MSRKFVKSFSYAYEGWVLVFKTQRNFRIQIAIGIFVLILGVLIGLGKTEWIILLFTIIFVLASEMINTAIESTVDLASDELHPKAKLAKDLSAGVVLLNSVVAIVVGVLLFLPRILELFK